MGRQIESDTERKKERGERVRDRASGADEWRWRWRETVRSIR